MSFRLRKYILKYLNVSLYGACLSLFSFIPCLSHAYELTPGPYTIEDLGSILQTNTQEHQLMYKTTDGHRHLMMFYNTFGVKPMDVVDIDVETDQVLHSVFENNMGRPGSQCAVFYPANNKVYVGSGDPGSWSEFDPTTGATRFIQKLKYKGAQYCEAGADGWIYIGQVTSSVAKGAGVERYNPQTQVWQDLGVIDPTFAGSLQYAYTLGADERYLYIGLGQLPWYLAVYDTQATIDPIKLYFFEDNDTGGTVSKGSDGKWYYQRINSAKDWYKKSYKFENGVPIEVATTPTLNSWAVHGNMVHISTLFGQMYKTQINLDKANPNSANNNTAIIGWQADAKPWQWTTLTNLALAPSQIKRIYQDPLDANKLLAWASNYGLVFTYDTSQGTLQELGYPQRSLYNAVFDKNMAYFSGYTGATLRYDRSKPWSLSASSAIMSTTINPYMITITPAASANEDWNGHYHYYSAIGKDGRIYIGTHHERSSTGGGLGWYDPVTGNNAGIREPFLDSDVQDVQAVMNGAKIVYSSHKGSTTEGKLFVLDVDTKIIERVITPIPGGGSLGKIVEAEPGMVIGYTNVAANTQYFKVNVLTGEILWVKNLGGLAFKGIQGYDQRLVKGPDGFIWLFVDSSLIRINPKDGAIETIKTGMAVSDLLFVGKDLYFYMDTGGGKVIKRIKNMFTGVAPAIQNYGDASSDGKVTAYDAALVWQYSQGVNVSFGDLVKVDVNVDGQVNDADALLIAQYAIGLVQNLP